MTKDLYIQNQNKLKSTPPRSGGAVCGAAAGASRNRGPHQGAATRHDGGTGRLLAAPPQNGCKVARVPCDALMRLCPRRLRPRKNAELQNVCRTLTCMHAALHMPILHPRTAGAPSSARAQRSCVCAHLFLFDRQFPASYMRQSACRTCQSWAPSRPCWPANSVRIPDFVTSIM